MNWTPIERKHIVCVVTARPSYARIQTALEALRVRGHRVEVVVTASARLGRYGGVEQDIAAHGWPVPYGVWCQLEGDAPSIMARTTALNALDLASHFERERPDAVITIADRHETLGTAMAAAYAHIPLIHLQGGELTGSIDDKVRDSVTALADLHCVATAQAQQRVWRMTSRGAIALTGCPSVDLAARGAATPLGVLPGVGPQVEAAGAVVVLWHPVTDEAEAAGYQTQQVLQALQGRPTIWFWPNVDRGTDAVSKVLRVAHERGAPIRFVRHIPALRFYRLLLEAGCLVGNSSVGIRECAYLGVPVVNIGNRQDGRERGPNVVDVSWPQAAAIREAVEAQHGGRYESSPLYGEGDAGVKVAEEVERWLTRRQVA